MIGAISFIYADGLTMLYQTWSNLTTPHVTFAIKPEKIYLPADGSSQLYIDIQLKNQDDQSIDGEEIIVAILKGEVSLTKSNNPPADISKRIFVQASNKPQIITLSFRYRQLVKTLNLEAFDPTPPAIPIIKAPTENTIFTTATPIVSGEATPNTKIEIYIDGILNTTIAMGDSNQFADKLETAVKKGNHKLSAATINKYGVRSELTPSVPIEIRTPDPEIDLLNLRIKPNPVTIGKSFQFFVPVSSGTKEVILILEDHNYALSDTNSSSIFSGNIPAPRKAGLYSISLTITTETGDRVIAEKVASILVN
ncbi:MAG: hypothetical protein V1719_01595 [Patescibacteria group bacterium]